MKQIKFIIAILITVSILTELNAQTNEIDSLENLLLQHTSNDTAKASLLNKTASKLLRIDNDKALKYANESYNIANKFDFAKAKAKSSFIIGLYWHINSNFPKAISNYQESLSVYTKLGDKKQISVCLNNIGLIYQTNSTYYQALEYLLKSLKIQEELGNKTVISACLNNIGIIHKEQGNYKLALKYFEKSLNVNKGINNKYGILRNLFNIGKIHKKQGNYQQAIKYYENSLNIAQELNDKEGVSMNIHYIGEIYLLQEKYKQALDKFQESLKIKEKIGDKELNCSSLFSIGTVYLKTKNYSKALSYTEQSLEIAEKHKLLNNQKEIHKQLSQIYIATKKYKQAYQENVLHHKLNDSIFNAQNIKKITSLELKYKFEKEKKITELQQQRKEAIYTEKLKRQKNITNIFFMALFIASIIIFLIYRLYHVKNKTNILLVKKNDEISLHTNLISEQKSEIQVQADKLLEHKNHLEKTVKQRTSELHAEKEKLEESEERFRAIAEQASEGIALTNLKGNYVFVNSAFSKMTGYSEAELLKLTISDMYKKHENIEINSSMFGKPLEFIIKRKNNSTFPILITVNTIQIANKKLLLGMITDISEQKETEKKLQKQNKELNIAKEKAEESDQLKTEFIHNMSHEIRTPLNGILGFSQILGNADNSEKKRKQYIEIIQSSGNQLLQIIDDILEISQLETKQVKISEKEICLNDLLLELFSIFDIKAKENKTPLYLKKGLPDKECRILTDDKKLYNILSILLKNALKFTNTGFIEFGYKLTHTSVNQLEIYVKDTGIGISPRSQEIIFKKFSQEEKSLSRNVGGLGLGLSIAKENTKLLGGKITLESEKGKGTTFYVTIPYKPVDTDTINNISSKEKLTEKQDKYTILLVEDEEVNHLYIETLIENEIEIDCNTIHAKHGKEAVKICRENPEINLILMDLKMPIMNGFEATKLIRKFRPNLPIIAQTAYSTSEEKEQALSIGCDDFISKPISEKTLNEIIIKYLPVV